MMVVGSRELVEHLSNLRTVFPVNAKFEVVFIDGFVDFADGGLSSVS